jgi:hypothetical protein
MKRPHGKREVPGSLQLLHYAIEEARLISEEAQCSQKTDGVAYQKLHIENKSPKVCKTA